MKDWTPSALLHASGMYWESCAIHAAVHLDVFTPLSGGPMTVTELADRTGCVPQSLDRLLTALCAMGLLIRQGETCELPPFSRDHLCRGNPGYLGHIVEHHRHLMPGWSKLDESVRENRPTRHRSSVDTEDTGERESFLMGMYNIANAQAERSVPHIDLSGRSHLLDLGGATGAYAIHFCRRNPGLSATVFDLPTTRPFAERVIADSGMADRISFAGGDFTTEDLPGGFDVAWLSQILHGAGFDESANIVRKAAQSLVPGGLLLIQEFILDDNRSGPQHPALFDLNMLVGTPDGQSYTRQELAGFMRNAGLEDIRRLPLDLPQGCGIMAGTDCHCVIETKRGHYLGRVIDKGSAIPNTGVPGNVGGYTVERLLRAADSGIFRPLAEIGDYVTEGQTVAFSGNVPVKAQISGIIRGLLQAGVPVTKGMKAGDIDARCERNHCFTISDKARAIGGGVLEAVSAWEHGVL